MMTKDDDREARQSQRRLQPEGEKDISGSFWQLFRCFKREKLDWGEASFLIFWTKCELCVNCKCCHSAFITMSLFYIISLLRHKHLVHFGVQAERHYADLLNMYPSSSVTPVCCARDGVCIQSLLFVLFSFSFFMLLILRNRCLSMCLSTCLCKEILYSLLAVIVHLDVCAGLSSFAISPFLSCTRCFCVSMFLSCSVSWFFDFSDSLIAQLLCFCFVVYCRCISLSFVDVISPHFLIEIFSLFKEDDDLDMLDAHITE